MKKSLTVGALALAAAFCLAGLAQIARAAGETVSSYFAASNTHPTLIEALESTKAQPLIACDKQATISVANTTTELVPLASGQTIVVCGFFIQNTTAGTWKYIDGTGTNCGTSASDLTQATPIADGGTVPMPGAIGGQLRTRVGRALCATAGTGTIKGFVTYAQITR